MKKITQLLFFFTSSLLLAQKPCEVNPKYNEFDFWIGNWTVYNKQDKIAGYSKISKILENCVLLEEWTSASQLKNGMTFSGKSYNTFDVNSDEWQQTWVDNVGGSTEFLHGKYENKALTFYTDLFKIDSVNYVKRKLTFYNHDSNTVRQHGEISSDEGKTWKTEYDLEYRRNHNTNEEIVSKLFDQLTRFYFTDDIQNLANLYSKKGIIKGYNTEIIGNENILKYWKGLKEKLGGVWSLDASYIEKENNIIWVKGNSTITDQNNIIHKVNFSLILIEEENSWKIFQDTYW